MMKKNNKILIILLLFGIAELSACQCLSKTVERITQWYKANPYFLQYTIDKDFHRALNANHYYIVYELVRLGANVSSKDTGGVTAYMKAAQHNNWELLKFLFIQGNKADILALDDAGKSVFDYTKDPVCLEELEYRKKDITTL